MWYSIFKSCFILVEKTQGFFNGIYSVKSKHFPGSCFPKGCATLPCWISQFWHGTGGLKNGIISFLPLAEELTQVCSAQFHFPFTVSTESSCQEFNFSENQWVLELGEIFLIETISLRNSLNSLKIFLRFGGGGASISVSVWMWHLGTFQVFKNNILDPFLYFRSYFFPISMVVLLGKSLPPLMISW